MVGCAVLFALLAWTVLRGQQASAGDLPASAEASGGDDPAGPGPWASESGEEEELLALGKEARKLRAALEALHPRGPYLVVDRSNNRIYLREGDSVLLAAPASTGSGTELIETAGEKRRWVFETPRGRFRVLTERPDPVWTKPDWAFLELGEPVPPRLSDRLEFGSLGEYALDLGDGYMIHGTLYERLLGRSITHGCVRVGRDALRAIARKTGPGTQVFIF